MRQNLSTLLHFEPNRDPTHPRDAATVIVLRDTDAGLSVFCVRRHAKSTFLGGALVFPGGKVDPADASDAWDALVTPVDARAELLAGERASARTLAIAACREMLEEAAILPTQPALDALEALALRDQLVEKGDLARLLEAQNLRLSLGSLTPWSRWITPEAETRRYDARFFLLELPPGQVGRHDQHETTMSLWASPRQLLEEAALGMHFLAPPTSRTLEMLARVSDVRGAKVLARAQSLLPICPRFVVADDSGSPYLALPGDPSHTVRERRVEGPTRFVLRDGTFKSEDPRDPSDCAPNPGVEVGSEP